MTEPAKMEVEMKYAKIEAEKKLEMEKKKYEVEQIERRKNYESAKVEADVVAKIENEEQDPGLLALSQYGITEDNTEERTRNYISSLTTLSSIGSQDPLPYLCEPVTKDPHPKPSPELSLEQIQRQCKELIQIKRKTQTEQETHSEESRLIHCPVLV